MSNFVNDISSNNNNGPFDSSYNYSGFGNVDYEDDFGNDLSDTNRILPNVTCNNTSALASEKMNAFFNKLGLIAQLKNSENNPIDYEPENPSTYKLEEYDDGLFYPEAKEPIKNIDIYSAILDELHINSEQMNIIIRKLTKQPLSKFSFVRNSKDFRILFFEDENKHLFTISLEKIFETNVLLFHKFNH